MALRDHSVVFAAKTQRNKKILLRFRSEYGRMIKEVEV